MSSRGKVRRLSSRGGIACLVLVLVLAGCTGSGDSPVPADASGGEPAPVVQPTGAGDGAVEGSGGTLATDPNESPALTLPELGLPHTGAEPSRPEAGELVMRFGSGNMNSPNGMLFDCNACFWHVYADGRFISRGGPPGGPPATVDGMVTAYLEQRLTPEGIELLRAEILSSPMVRPRPGRWYTSYAWFSADAFDGDRAHSVTWSDTSFTKLGTEGADGSFTKFAEFYARMSQPGSWLPASAWADARIRAFVPSRYFVFGGEGPIHPRALPSPADSLLRPRGCQLISAQEAHKLVTAFEDGLEPTRVGAADPTSLGYRYPRNRGVGYIDLAPALPHETSCR